MEQCPSTIPNVLEYNLWTAPDCVGLAGQNGNRSWFYYSVTTPPTLYGMTIRYIPHVTRACVTMHAYVCVCVCGCVGVRPQFMTYYQEYIILQESIEPLYSPCTITVQKVTCLECN